MVTNTVVIPIGSTLADIISSLESIGFTNDTTVLTSTTAILTWDKDTDKNFGVYITVPVSGAFVAYFRDITWSNSANLMTISHATAVPCTNSATTIEMAIDYRTFGDSILIGFRPTTQQKQYFGCILAPTGANDYWYILNKQQYGAAWRPGWRSGNQMTVRTFFAQASAANIIQQNPESAVELVKFYDMNGYIDNLECAILHPDCNQGLCYKATVGNKTFLLWNWTTYTGGNAYQGTHAAFDITNDLGD